MNTERKTCCFFGHRKITEEEKLKERLTEIFENLIVNENIDTFFMGSRGEFNDLCEMVLSELKEKYTHIKRIYIRAEYPIISEHYENYLLKSCEETYYSKRATNGGKAVYIKRNFEMIDKSAYCVVYYKESYMPPRRKISRRDLFDYQPKSGTKLAYEYAVKKKKEIINVLEEI